jgi:hypothetical protein
MGHSPHAQTGHADPPAKRIYTFQYSYDSWDFHYRACLETHVLALFFCVLLELEWFNMKFRASLETPFLQGIFISPREIRSFSLRKWKTLGKIELS